jgi:small redox-active disulfide protein 2
MEVKVLGTGCARCKTLCGEVDKAIQRLGIDATITKVEKIDEIQTYRVLMTPALVVDGKVKAAGRIPSPAELDEWLAAAFRSN